MPTLSLLTTGIITKHALSNSIAEASVASQELRSQQSPESDWLDESASLSIANNFSSACVTLAGSAAYYSVKADHECNNR